MRYITAIHDNKANDIVGTMFVLHRAHAAAIRMYSDAASNPQNEIGKHPEDYDLVCVGYIEDEERPEKITAAYEIILTGAQWVAARAASLQISE